MINFDECPVEYSRKEPFELVLNELSKIENPSIIEIGCIRSINDVGAGNSSELFGWFVSKFGGTFTSCDIDFDNIQLCKSVVEKYANKKSDFNFYNSDGIEFTKNYIGKANLLYLDALDAHLDNFVESAVFHYQTFKEFESKLNPGDFILIDDNLNEKLEGKGYVLIPYLKEKNYDVLYSGYQWLFKVR